jgi:Protein of unknown function (DUF3303)
VFLTAAGPGSTLDPVPTKGEAMKFVIEYRFRNDGLTHDLSIANSAALLTAFSKWKPEDGLKVHAFLGTVAASGGYVFVEADDAKVVQAFVSKFVFWNEVTVVPVLDVGESVANAHAAITWAAQATKA